MPKLFFFLGLICVTCNCAFLRSPAADRAEFDYLKKNIEKVDCDNSDRLLAAQEILSRSGAVTEIREYEKASNVVAAFEGKNEQYIVVGAHFDKTTSGCGAIDNWTGVVMLSLLARDVATVKPLKSYRFVAFGGEERDLQGSKAMADAIGANAKSKPCAMVNLDSFGFERAWGLKSISDRSMLMLAADVERKRGGSFSIRDYRGASSDSKSFQRIGVPSITFSGLGDDWRDYLHTNADQVSNIDFGMIAENYDFVRAFVMKLDNVSCESLNAEQPH